MYIAVRASVERPASSESKRVRFVRRALSVDAAASFCSCSESSPSFDALPTRSLVVRVVVAPRFPSSNMASAASAGLGEGISTPTSAAPSLRRKRSLAYVTVADAETASSPRGSHPRSMERPRWLLIVSPPADDAGHDTVCLPLLPLYSLFASQVCRTFGLSSISGVSLCVRVGSERGR